MGSTISWHIEKHQLGAVNGLQIHNDRLGKSHKNERIDTEKTFLNLVDFGDPEFEGLTYHERIKKVISERYRGKRSPRKDAIVDVQHTLQFGGDEINELDNDTKLAVMTDALEFVIDIIGGRQNVLAVNYHADETNDHLHMDTIPLTSDGRLSAKEMYSRVNLHSIQEELLVHMQKSYPELNFERADKVGRGFDNGRSQADFERLKDEQRNGQRLYQEQSNELKEGRENLERDMKNWALDILENEEPKLSVTQDVYDSQFRNTNDPAEFIGEFGFGPKPVGTPSGRKQMFSWLSADWLVNRAKKVWQSAKERLERLVPREKAVIIAEKEIAEKQQDLKVTERNMYFDLMDHVSGVDTPENERLEQIADVQNIKVLKPSEIYQIWLDQKVDDNLTKPKELLADVAISLGVHESWRETMIEKGGMVGRTKGGKVLDKPFSELIPERLKMATVEQLKFAQFNIQQQKNRDQGFGRGR
jgi:Plasmid recombination enzyme.